MSRRSARSRYSEQPSEYPDNYEAEGEDDEEEDEEEEVPAQGSKVPSNKGKSTRGGVGTRGTPATDAEDGEDEDEVDEEDDEQEITRCICGQDELTSINPQVADLLNKEYNITKIDQGLFIQCDKCSVWQHGYCVGLFINDDVPDKYWCELCKPDLHIFIYSNTSVDELVRTLYRPTNDKRKKLLAMEGHKAQPHHHHNHQHNQQQSPPSNNDINDDSSSIAGRSKSKRSSNEQSPQPTKASRKERRHYDDSYDEQLQKALRESAKESGIPLGSTRASSENATNSTAISSSNSTGKRRGAKSDDSDESKHNVVPKSEIESDQDPSNIEDDTESATAAGTTSFKRAKPRGRTAKAKKPRGSTPVPKSSNNNASNEGSGISALTKEELINQPSKPRYVSEKSNVYELRKRTGAILEWLGRSQIELEEEKSNKIELFSYKEEIEINGIATHTGISIIESDDHDNVRTIVETSTTTSTSKPHEEDNNKLINTFNENLKLMENLTEKILLWEQKFGKYAP